MATQTIRFRNSMHDLPDELAEKVISYLEMTTLYQCLFVSKRAYRITLPLLYRVVRHRMYLQPSRLQSAIKAVINKPQLQSKIETIILRDPQPNDWFWDMDSWHAWARKEYKATISNEEHALFMSAPERKVDGTLLAENVQNHEEAQAALLISLAPNLRTLHIENPTTEDEPPRFLMDHLMLSSLYPGIKEGRILQNLTTLNAVTARLEGGQGGFRLSSIATFFFLPNLRRVAGVACFEPEDDLYKEFDCPLGESGVVDLRFVRSSICPIGILEMLNSCRAVRSFDCDWAGLSVGWVEVNFPKLQEALERHQDSLQCLRLDTRKHYDSWPERDDGLVSPLGGRLRECSSLTKLEVPASALIGWDEDGVGGFERLVNSLPPNIEDLHINEWAPRLVKDLEEFVPVCTAMYTRLRRITVTRLSSDSEHGAEIEERLLRRFRNLAPHVSVRLEDGSEIDHFDGSVGSASV